MRKQYIQPQATGIQVELSKMVCTSGPDANSQGNPHINPSRRYRGDWEEEYDEEEEER
ncbi:MAG: hypothetical protein IKP33_02685 [Prevotella sp.]|nr:hypothetical protein [Prevotella sp.]